MADLTSTYSLSPIASPGSLKLKTPETVTQYQEPQPNLYDTQSSFLEKILQDQTGKYIGSLPKIGGQTKSATPKLETPASVAPLQAQAASNEVMNTANTAPTFKTNSSDLIPIASQVVQGVDSMVQAGKNMARNEYESDMRTYLEQGKYWFDPNRDLKPDLDEYLSEMPSSVDSLSPGRSAANIGLIAASGAATGASVGGPWGALIGGGAGLLVGAVEELFSWRSAKEEDRKNEARIKSEYEKKLKEWTIRKNRRLRDMRSQQYERRKAERQNKKMDKANDTAIKAQALADRRQQIANALMSAGSVSSAHQKARLARYGVK